MLSRVTMSGAPYERGRQHGEQVSHLIEKALSFYLRYSSEERDEVLAEAKRIESVLSKRWPDVVQELEGIAAGAKLPYEDILLLNVYYECDAGLPRRCTAIGLPHTADGPLLGKTDDLDAGERELDTFYRLEPERGYASIYYAIAGTLWAGGGVNQAGLAHAMTGAVRGKAWNPRGIPAGVFTRLVLDRCASIEEALAMAQSEPPLRWGTIMVLAHSSVDEVAVLENYPTARGIERSRNQPLVRTNHCLLPQTIPLMASAEEQDALWPGLRENSHRRHQNAARLASSVSCSVEGLKCFLGDHSVPGPICQHGQANLYTSVAMILVPRRRAIIAAEDYGCGSYREWRV